MKNPRILLISPLPPPSGGIATWSVEYIKWMKKNHYIVDILDIALTGKRKQSNTASRSFFDEIVRTWKIYSKLKNKINRKKPDIVHLNTSCGLFGIIRDFFIVRYVTMNNVRIVTHFRCNIEDQIHNCYQKYFLNKLCRSSDKIIVLNYCSKKYLRLKFNVKSIVVPNFISEDFILKDSKPISNQIKKVLFSGHVVKTKGVREILMASKSLMDVIFYVAGTISKEFRNIDDFSNVIFLGNIQKSDMLVWLNQCDVFLFPTYTEGFSNSLLEAMAAGLPIITTNVGANADMIETNGGLLIPLKNVNSIVDSFNFLKKVERRKEMSKWNIQKVINNYTPGIVMNALLKVYKELLDNG